MVHRSVVGLLRSLRGGRDAASGAKVTMPSLARFGPDVKLQHLSTIDIFRDLASTSALMP